MWSTRSTLTLPIYKATRNYNEAHNIALSQDFFHEMYVCTCYEHNGLDLWGCYKDLDPNINGMYRYHIECGLPHFLNLHAVIQLCDGCEEYYVPEPKPGNFPVKWPLCLTCGSKVPTRRRYGS